MEADLSGEEIIPDARGADEIKGGLELLILTTNKGAFLVSAIAVFLTCGCAGGQGSIQSARGNSQNGPTRPIIPQQIQTEIMSFADRYSAAMTDVFNRAEYEAKTPEDRLLAIQCKLLAVMGAVGNAVDPNPVVGMMDMALMVTLNREIFEEAWARESFGEESAKAIVAALKTQEGDIWNVVDDYLKTNQIAELHELAARWRREHPNQRYLISARLADFPEGHASNQAAVQFANSIFGMIKLDPFTGLDPALREVAESRVLVERMFFYMQRMPAIMTWQIDVQYQQMLMQPQVVKLLNDTATVAGSTTRFTDSTARFADVSSRFADAGDRFADTIERFRTQLPDQQSKLVDQLNDVITHQREGAITQATTQVSSIRDATVRELNKTVTSQQDLMTKNLKGVSDQSIDRLYERLRSLLLITAGAVVAILLLYRIFALIIPRKRS